MLIDIKNEDHRKELKGLLAELAAGTAEKAVAEAVEKLQEENQKTLGEIREKMLFRLMPTADQAEDKKERHAKFVANVIKAHYGSTKAREELLEMRGKAALAEGSDATGGYMVPDEMESTIIGEAYQQSAVAGDCTRMPMGSDTLLVPRRGNAVSLNWTAEGTAATESEPTVGQVELVAKKLDAYALASNELLADAAPNVMDWLYAEFSEAVALELDNQILNGTGTPCSGIMTAAAGYSVVMGSGSTSFSAIHGDNLSEMISKIKTITAGGARFYLHRSVMHYIRTLKDSNGNYVYNAIAGQQAGQAWGYPIVLSDKAPSSSGPSTAFVVFGNPRFFMLGYRMGVRLDWSEHVKFLENQQALRLTARFAPKIGVANAFARLITAGS